MSMRWRRVRVCRAAGAGRVTEWARGQAVGAGAALSRAPGAVRPRVVVASTLAGPITREQLLLFAVRAAPSDRLCSSSRWDCGAGAIEEPNEKFFFFLWAGPQHQRTRARGLSSRNAQLQPRQTHARARSRCVGACR